VTPVYQIADRKDSRALSQYLVRNGQLLLPMVELISSAQLAVEEFMEVLGRAALEAVLELSAQQVAGPRHQGQAGGEIRRHGAQGGVVSLSTQKVRVRKPRLRRKGGGAAEVHLSPGGRRGHGPSQTAGQLVAEPVSLGGGQPPGGPGGIVHDQPAGPAAEAAALPGEYEHRGEPQRRCEDPHPPGHSLEGR